MKPRFNSWRRRRAAIGSTLVLLLSMAGARADVVSDWNATAQGVFLAKGANSGVYFAMMHIAIYDAVNAIDGRYTVFAVKPTSDARGASKEAAAAAAAYNTLLSLFPDQQPTLQNAYAASLARIPDGAAKTRGIKIGEEVSVAWLASRVGDGREAVIPYVFGTEPGDYQRTPPAFPNPAPVWFATVKPFALTSPSQFRAYGPPDLTSWRYAQDVNTVKELGSLNSTKRTAEQTEIAMFHTENPTTYWAHNIRDLVATRPLSVEDSARFFAMVFVGYGDAAIACFDSKYHFNRWRPVTAIVNADADGNDATAADSAWLPLANTPAHPEYPAAHGCVSAAVADTLKRFFGPRNFQFTMTSSVANTKPHVYRSTDEFINEVMMARVWGGMHFPTSTVHGAAIGHHVAAWVEDNYFRKVKNRK